MGLLDSISGALSSAPGGSASGDISGLISGLLPQLGGLQGLVNTLSSQGLGDIVSSWVGKGPNLPISAEQITSALGGPLQALASSTGQSADQVSAQLAQHLPGVVDKLTPDGAVPAQDPLTAGLQTLKGLLG